jgi:hypothetical protein
LKTNSPLDEEDLMPVLSPSHPKAVTNNNPPEGDDPDDMYSPDRMALKAIDTPHAGVTEGAVALPNRIAVGKPSKQAYFRHSPDFYIQTLLVNHEASRAYYFPATQEIRNDLSEFVKPVELFGIQTLGGDFRFWPININEMENDWTESAKEILQEAIEAWVGYRSLEGRYAVRYPHTEPAEPTWPTVGMKDLLARCFRGTHTIKDSKHPVYRKLLGK